MSLTAFCLTESVECSFRASILARPPDALINCAALFCSPDLLEASKPALRIFARASRATFTIWSSETTARSSHIGGRQPCCTKTCIWSWVPPEVAFAMAQAASFFTTISASPDRKATSNGTNPASITAWIWSLLPAVMLETVQQASFWMPFLEWLSSFKRHGSPDNLTMVWVCTSLPVTMFPTVRRAGVWTVGEACMRSSTRRGHTPASITAWILSLGPSER
mmetsp:Transcript_12730/g.29953  ORF Transcript_12730/g.29953 Transcript_12730/m.29953 type:complete len:222 (-) Transcript_12730:19-684(-)